MSLPALSSLRLTFDEEFTSFLNSPDGGTGTWMTSYPYSGWAARTLSGNSEAEFYSDASVGADPFSLSGGVLRITASPATPGSNAGNLPYTSGLITTNRSFSQTYGYFEVRAKLPAGQGLWPAFWLLPASNSYTAELDVFEVLGHQPGLVYSSVHGDTGGIWATDIRGNATADTSDGFHVFGVDWGPDTTTFYMDGQVLSTARTPASMNTPMFMLLNLAVGNTGSWPGAPGPATVFPATMQIDYVRAYATADTRDASGAALVGAVPGAPVSLGTGPNTLTLSMSGDAWQGDARFTVTVDGVQVGGTQAVSAAHRTGAVQLFQIRGDFGPGRHGVVVDFVNDAYGGSGAADRNLYVVAATLDGAAVLPAGLTLLGPGRQAFSFAGAGTAAALALSAARPAASPLTLGAGMDVLALTMSEDAWLGDARFTVSVDGRTIGSAQTLTASHAAGRSQIVNVLGDFAPGRHVVRVSLLNDAYGGTADTDRNLYVEGVTLNGIPVATGTVAVLSNSQDIPFTALAFVADAAPVPAVGDFDGNGRADILWQNAAGRLADWLVNADGSGLLGYRLLGGDPGPGWHVRGTGDFNADGRSDILWQHDSGRLADWLVGADGLLGYHLLGGDPGPGWHVRGTGDFNGDGRADILWQHDNGQVADWLVRADGSDVLGFHLLGGDPGAGWHIKGVGDFNADGRADILWQHDNGRVADWLVRADGGGLLGYHLLGGDPGPGWHVRGTGDFNGDGRSDILWQNANGRVADWLVNADGSDLLGYHLLGVNPGPDWHIRGTGDFDGDGRSDILWQNASGQAANWLIDADGSGARSYNLLGDIPGSGWAMAG